MAKYLMADLIIEFEPQSPVVCSLCRDYLVSSNAVTDIDASVTDADIAAEHEYAVESDCGDAECEFLAIQRKICQGITDFDAMLLHCAAVSVDNKAYLFTAVSGTGKSTHISLWKKLLGDRVTVVNGDKPFLRLINGVWCVCGTPWSGKEGWNTPVNVPIAGICHLTRADNNSIVPISSEEIVPIILNQTFRPDEPNSMFALLGLIDSLVRNVPAYRLGCNMNIEAAKVSFTGMGGVE